MKAIGVGPDLKRLVREPIMILLFLVPLLALCAIKVILTVGMPILLKETGFDLTPWLGYVLCEVLLIAPGMLGAVAGFMMIDDRDERMTDLMAVTPLGFSGYMQNRLMMPFIMSVAYTLLGYFLLNIYELNGIKLVLICLMTGMESITVGLFLYLLTDNKVKGLTYAKGLSGLMITALADLAGIPWLSVLCGFLPFYWVTQVALKPISLLTVVLAILVYGFWLCLALFKVSKR